MKRLLVAALLGCGAQSKPVTVVTVPASSSSAEVVATPREPVAWQPFLDAGCVAKETELDCSKSTLEGASKCLWPLRHVAVAFDPPAYVAECHVRDGDGLRTTGCKLTSNVVLYAAKRSGIVRIATKKELVAAFAPVKTAEEAIAFAHVLSGDDAYDKAVTADDGTAMITRPLLLNDDFRFKLFRSQICGCEHPVSSVNYRVTRDGTVTEIAHAIVLRNAHDDGMCKD
jgi:hypothetical protein